MGEKKPLEIDIILERVREAVKPYPKAALFALADLGYRSLFTQLIACILSIRTFDEVSLPTAVKLFETAPTAAELAALPANEIDDLIHMVSFLERKAEQIKEIARITNEQYAGQLPCDETILLGFHGVGVKCAHLALGVACGQAAISVDIHVHRVTNRWGYVQTSTPEQTTLALEEKLPKKYWVEINSLLVPFGKHICTGSLPHCSTCPVVDRCRQVGVTKHR